MIGRVPFHGNNPKEMFSKIVRQEVEFPDSFENNCAKNLIRNLLQKSIRRRLGCLLGGINDIKEHDFFNELNWKLLKIKDLKAPWRPAPPRKLLFRRPSNFTSNKYPPVSKEMNYFFTGLLDNSDTDCDDDDIFLPPQLSYDSDDFEDGKCNTQDCLACTIC